MKLTYTFSNIGKGNDLKTKAEAIKSTDDAAKAVKDLINAMGDVLYGEKRNWFINFQLWLMGSCYKKTLTKDYVEYNFWLLGFFEKFAVKDKSRA